MKAKTWDTKDANLILYKAKEVVSNMVLLSACAQRKRFSQHQCCVFASAFTV